MLDAERARRLARRYELHFLIAEQPFDLPAAYRHGRFTVYDLRPALRSARRSRGDAGRQLSAGALPGARRDARGAPRCPRRAALPGAGARRPARRILGPLRYP